MSERSGERTCVGCGAVLAGVRVLLAPLCGTCWKGFYGSGEGRRVEAMKLPRSNPSGGDAAFFGRAVVDWIERLAAEHRNGEGK